MAMERDEQRRGREPEEERDPVDEASEESFPASDPPSWEPMHSGTPEPDDQQADGDAASDRP
jgi:hypothetical protein